MTRIRRPIVVKLLPALALMLMAALTASMPALAQNTADQYSGPATVTFELTVEGNVPEGKLLGVSTGIADAPAPVFCSTASYGAGLPKCEDGSTYTDTFTVLPAGSTLSYEYYVMDYDYGGVVGTFASDTITVTDGQTVSATYRAGAPEGERVTSSASYRRRAASARSSPTPTATASIPAA